MPCWSCKFDCHVPAKVSQTADHSGDRNDRPVDRAYGGLGVGDGRRGFERRPPDVLLDCAADWDVVPAARPAGNHHLSHVVDQSDQSNEAAVEFHR